MFTCLCSYFYMYVFMCENKDDDDDDDDDVSICSSCTDEHVAETARDDDVFKRLQRRRPSA